MLGALWLLALAPLAAAQNVLSFDGHCRDGFFRKYLRGERAERPTDRPTDPLRDGTHFGWPSTDTSIEACRRLCQIDGCTFFARCNDGSCCSLYNGASCTRVDSAHTAFEACSVESQACNTDACVDYPVDCTGSYGDWGDCSATCGGGTQSRVYTVATPAANGGAACPTDTESQACNTDACYPTVAVPQCSINKLGGINWCDDRCGQSWNGNTGCCESEGGICKNQMSGGIELPGGSPNYKCHCGGCGGCGELDGDLQRPRPTGPPSFTGSMSFKVLPDQYGNQLNLKEQDLARSTAALESGLTLLMRAAVEAGEKTYCRQSFASVAATRTSPPSCRAKLNPSELRLDKCEQLGWACPGPCVGGCTGSAQAWLRAHNVYRCMHDVPAVTWSDHVYRHAHATFKDQSDMTHSDSYGVAPPAGPASENLATWTPPTPERAVWIWYEEVHDCDWSKSCAWQHGDGTQVGHFTALIWNGAREIGCGINRHNMMYCRYRAGDQFDCHTPNNAHKYGENVFPAQRSQAECEALVDACGPPQEPPEPPPEPPGDYYNGHPREPFVEVTKLVVDGEALSGGASPTPPTPPLASSSRSSPTPTSASRSKLVWSWRASAPARSPS